MTATLHAKPVLRVAHVALQLEHGGLEKLLVEFARHADRSRFDLRFVCLTRREGVAGEIEACGWPVIALNEPPGISPRLVLRLMKLFRDADIDIVQTHNTKPLFYAAPAARMARVAAVVHTSHGSRRGASRAETFAFVNACRIVDRVVCVSRDVEALRRGEGIPQRKLQTIWNGIDTSRFAYHGPNPAGPALLLARLRPEKDLPTLLRAAAMVVQRHPDFQLEIAGDGECAADWRRLSDDLGLSKHVTFLGDVSDAPSLLKRARLLVCSSVAEGLSLSLLEAMACGLPVVATRVGGNIETVVEGQTGLLVPAADSTSLAEAIMQIWNNPELASRMGREGANRVERHFDVRRMIANYQAIYEQLVPEAHGGARIGYAQRLE